MPEEPKRPPKLPEAEVSGLTGLICFGAMVTGMGGLVAAFVAVIAGGRSGFADAGTCLIASALAFGLLGNAILRK